MHRGIKKNEREIWVKLQKLRLPTSQLKATCRQTRPRRTLVTDSGRPYFTNSNRETHRNGCCRRSCRWPAPVSPDFSGLIAVDLRSLYCNLSHIHPHLRNINSVTDMAHSLALCTPADSRAPPAGHLPLAPFHSCPPRRHLGVYTAGCAQEEDLAHEKAPPTDGRKGAEGRQFAVQVPSMRADEADALPVPVLHELYVLHDVVAMACILARYCNSLPYKSLSTNSVTAIREMMRK